jgi:hypothetical protein
MLLRTHSSTTTNLSPSEAMHRPLVLRRLCSIMIGCLTPDWNQLPSHLLGNRHKSVERSNHNHWHEEHEPRQSESEVAPVPQNRAVKACMGHGGIHYRSWQYIETELQHYSLTTSLPRNVPSVSSGRKRIGPRAGSGEDIYVYPTPY